MVNIFLHIPRTNINRHVSNSLLPRSKKKHTQIDSDVDSSDSYTGSPKQLTEQNAVSDNIEENEFVTKHPFSSSRTKLKIFRLESSSDEIDSDVSQAHINTFQASLPLQNLHSPLSQKSTPLSSPLLSSQELYISPLGSDMIKKHVATPDLSLEEESVGICFDDCKNPNSDHSLNFEEIEVKKVDLNFQDSNSIFDSPINAKVPSNALKLLSKTSTPNPISILSDSDVIFVDSNSRLRNVPISPMIENPITSESFTEVHNTSSVCKINGKCPRKILESSDSENEALNSLFKKRKFHSKRRVISSQFSPELVLPNKVKKHPIKKRKLNSFIDYEAIESEGEYSDNSFISPVPPKNRSLSETSNYVGNSSISHFIADTSVSTGCNDSSMYARYVRDIISPQLNPKYKLVIDPKKHKILAHAGNNILK